MRETGHGRAREHYRAFQQADCHPWRRTRASECCVAYFAALPVSVSMCCAASVCRGCFYTALRAARLCVQQQQLINDTGADGVSYLDRALEFIIESMDLAHAECPAKSQEPTTV